jgi:hypothetical protein
MAPSTIVDFDRRPASGPTVVSPGSGVRTEGLLLIHSNESIVHNTRSTSSDKREIESESVNQSISQSISQSVNQSVSQSVSQSVGQSMTKMWGIQAQKGKRDGKKGEEREKKSVARSIPLRSLLPVNILRDTYVI